MMARLLVVKATNDRIAIVFMERVSNQGENEEIGKKAPRRPAGGLAAKVALWSSSPSKKRHGPARGLYEGVAVSRWGKAAKQVSRNGHKSLTAQGLSDLVLFGGQRRRGGKGPCLQPRVQP
jgi:hypothetical protein